MQADALRERLQALETEDHDRPIVKFLHDIPPFYEKALRGYQREIVTHFVEAVAPAFPSEAQAKRVIEAQLPAVHVLDAFICGVFWLRSARENPLAGAGSTSRTWPNCRKPVARGRGRPNEFAFAPGRGMEPAAAARGRRTGAARAVSSQPTARGRRICATLAVCGRQPDLCPRFRTESGARNVAWRLRL